jgi:hypothetical protein
MKMLRLVAGSVAAICLSDVALAQTPPVGWAVQKDANQWVATSPDQGHGLRVKLVYKTAVKPQGVLDLWFPDAHQRVAQEYGRIVVMGKVDTLAQPDLDRMVASSIAVEPKSGPKRVSVIAYAYDNAQGREMIMIILPSTLGKLNPAYKQAFATMNDFWRGGQVYKPTP